MLADIYQAWLVAGRNDDGDGILCDDVSHGKRIARKFLSKFPDTIPIKEMDEEGKGEWFIPSMHMFFSTTIDYDDGFTGFPDTLGISLFGNKVYVLTAKRVLNGYLPFERINAMNTEN